MLLVHPIAHVHLFCVCQGMNSTSTTRQSVTGIDLDNCSVFQGCKLSTFYQRVYQSLLCFCLLVCSIHCLSHVLQAQIAMANTALTVLGMWILHIPGIGLLGLFVFICSFIPIAGVFISTAPIAFVALTEYGFLKVSCTALCCAVLCCAMLCYAIPYGCCAMSLR